MEHIMVDLETLGTRAYSAIISIGAIEFDPSTGRLGDEFYRVIDLKSCGNAGLTMDSGTVSWWMQQSGEARKVFDGSGIPLDCVLKDFFNFCGPIDKHAHVKLWGNGANFDNVLLRCAYEKVGIAAPWQYYNDRCYRTLKSINRGVPFERVGTYHNALDDAKSQALHLMQFPVWGK